MCLSNKCKGGSSQNRFTRIMNFMKLTKGESDSPSCLVVDISFQVVHSFDAANPVSSGQRLRRL